MVSVSVIVTVYNVEKYIERCVRSLMEQTLEEEIEFIFVDDCSPDDSIGVVKRVAGEYPKRQEQIRILHNEENRGVSATRQRGVDNASGKYIIHCDPDDWVDPDMYGRLLEDAERTGSDITLCGLQISDGETYSRPLTEKAGGPTVTDLVESLSGRLRHTFHHGGLCNKLIKSACYEGVRFPTGINYCEDVHLLFQIAAARPETSVSYITDWYPYYYFQRPGSLVSLTPERIARELELFASLEAICGSNSRLRACSESFAVRSIAKGAFPYSGLTSRQFRRRYLPWKKAIRLNHRMGKALKFRLWISLLPGMYQPCLRINNFLKYAVRKVTGKPIRMH